MYLIFNSELFNLSVERCESDFEQSGGFGLVAVRMAKHTNDVVSLNAFQVEGIIGSRRRLNRKHIDWQVVTCDLAVAHDESMLDVIHHLTHIAGPLIRQE